VGGSDNELDKVIHEWMGFERVRLAWGGYMEDMYEWQVCACEWDDICTDEIDPGYCRHNEQKLVYDNKTLIIPSTVPKYTESLDDLRPVFNKLNEINSSCKECENLLVQLWHHQEYQYRMEFTLLLTPREHCELIVEMIAKLAPAEGLAMNEVKREN